MLTVKPASDRTVDLLMSAGVHMDEWRLPAELKETHAGLRICHDDIIDFHALLADDAATADALRRLAEA